ncbi:MAG: sigma-70 family RNA polymerase sigma factor [Bacilli bacterium]|nr:sigma-70 family RNA polymerase sigma factor [Bacilli bacterium]
MGKYKVEISGCKTSDLISLTPVEMKQLFQIRDKEKWARELLIEGNFKLVLSVLKKFYHKEQNMDDLFQVGCIGLIKAIDNFDLSYDVQFSTYAVPMIMGEIRRFMRDNSSLRISRSLKDIAYRTLKIIDKCAQSGIQDIDYDDIAKQLGVSLYDVYTALSAMREPISMYEPIYNDGGDTIYVYDQIVDESINTDFSDKVAFEDALGDLDEREKYILDQRYVIGKTQMEVADDLNISQAQVSRLEKKAIKELKKTLNE